MQAITTTYLGPTNYRGERIRAKCDAGSVTIPYPYGLSGEKAYIFAAHALCDRLGWNSSNLVTGNTFRGEYVHVFVNHEQQNHA